MRKVGIKFWILMLTVIMVGFSFFVNIEINKKHPEKLDLKLERIEKQLDYNANNIGKAIVKVSFVILDTMAHILPQREASKFMYSGAGKTFRLIIYKIGLFIIIIPMASLFLILGILNGVVERAKNNLQFIPPSTLIFHLAYKLGGFTTFVIFCVWLMDVGILNFFILSVILCSKSVIIGYLTAKNFPYYI